MKSECAGVGPSNCLANYGFSANESGAYRIGPGPSGQVLRGQLSKAEADELFAGVSSYDPATAAGREYCADLAEDGALDQVLITAASGTRTLMEEIKPGTLCVYGIENSLGRKLHAILRRLAARHSPPEFPNTCTNAISDLDRLYLETIACNVAADCAWIDNDFKPILADERSQLPPIDDCAYAPRPAVANAFTTTALQLKLLLARELAQEVCGPAFLRSSCASTSADGSKPGCVRGRCRVVSTSNL